MYIQMEVSRISFTPKDSSWLNLDCPPSCVNMIRLWKGCFLRFWLLLLYSNDLFYHPFLMTSFVQTLFSYDFLSSALNFLRSTFQMKTCDLLCGGLHGSLQKGDRPTKETITPWYLTYSNCVCASGSFESMGMFLLYIKMDAGKLILSCFVCALEKRRRQPKARKLGCWWQGMFCSKAKT